MLLRYNKFLLEVVKIRTKFYSKNLWLIPLKVISGHTERTWCGDDTLWKLSIYCILCHSHFLTMSVIMHVQSFSAIFLIFDHVKIFVMAVLDTFLNDAVVLFLWYF